MNFEKVVASSFSFGCKGLFALGRKIRFGVYKKIENFVNANFWFLWARSHLRLANFL